MVKDALHLSPTQLEQAGRDPFSSSLLKVDIVKVRRAGLFSKQTCDALPNRGQVQSNPCGLLNSKLTCGSIGLAHIQTVLQVVWAGRIANRSIWLINGIC